MDNHKRPVQAVFLIVFLGLVTVLSIVGFALPWRSEVASEEGAGIDGVITYLLVATGAILLVGHLVLCRFIWNSTNGEDKYKRPSKRAELLWGLIPVFVMLLISEAGVLAIASPVWKSLYIDKPANPFIVEVTGKQFEWLIRYPGVDGVFGKAEKKWVNGLDNPLGVDEDDDNAMDDIVKRGTLYLPVNRAIIVHLSTHDVLHSFFVPAFRVKQDLVPGFNTQIKFTPTKTGDYELACAELCGLGHYKMRGTVHVLEPDAFDAWLQEQMKFGG